MEKIKLLILILLLLSINFKADAYSNCYKSGYTVVSVNGIFTDDIGAKNNKENLKKILPSVYKNEPIIVDYIYNSTHLAGVGDLVDVTRQGLFDSNSDFDLVDMLDDASEKIKTQKVLLVGHSQGNFYTNNFYDKVAGKIGGVPVESIGVYGVATPADRVAGGGKYLTSDTDSVIATLVGSLKNIMSPNTHIDLNGVKSNGHDFSEIYLKYRGDKIVSDIKSSLDKLNINKVQDDLSQCISSQKISTIHKVGGAVLGVADVVVKSTVYAGTFAYNTIAGSLKSVASLFKNNSNKNLAAVGLYDEQNLPEPIEQTIIKEDAPVEVINNTNDNNQTPVEEQIKNVKIENNIEESDSVIINPEILIPIPENLNTINTEVVGSENNNSNHSGGGGGGNNSSDEVITTDTLPPVITLVGEDIINTELNIVYVDKGATALDEKDGVVDVVTTGTVDIATIGTYIITYTATDTANNTSTLTRTVNVVKNESLESIEIPNLDIIAPVITLLGENVETVLQDAIYVDAGATSLDDIDGVVMVVTTGVVDTKVLGTYTITYTATDIANNISTLTRTVNVIKNEIIVTPEIDTVAPVITLLGNNTVTVFLNNVYTDTGATALDDEDGIVTVVTTGVVDTKILGTYILTYTATDTANNTSTLTRTVNVKIKIPVVSTTAVLSLPNSGTNALDGLDPNRGRKNLTPFIFQVIYTDSNNKSPQYVKLHVKNITTGDLLADVLMNKISSSTDILSDGDFANGELYTVENTYGLGDYSYSFSANDLIGNYTKIEENTNLRFSAIASNYIYIPKASFGVNNGDDKDWQVWSFNGSNVYDWTDTYVNNYLREQFKIQTYTGGYWCSQCLQRGLFSHDPQKGFEISDLSISTLEGNPQNSMNGKTYEVAIQWDSSGYSYKISHDSIIDAEGHTDVANMNNNLWVGWDGSFNNFTIFPFGTWQGVPYSSPMERTGGSDMVLKPYPVYDPQAVQIPDPTPTPEPEPEPEPTPVLSSEKSIISFSFENLNPVINGVIGDDYNISLTVPYGTDVSNMIPVILTSEKSSILPISMEPQNFTDSISYIVKAENGTTLSYFVTVIISPEPEPEPEPNPDPIVPDNTVPTIISYFLNGNQSSISINPLINNLEIVLNSNKNVNWMTIKIEKESDSRIYKMFQSGGGCLDGTNICTKVWDGTLSSGELLQSGNYDGSYKIKAHIKDIENREYEEYLESSIIVNTQ